MNAAPFPLPGPSPAAIGGTRTTCPYCGVGCGIVARRESGGAITVSGDPDHPANFGRLCSKGLALADTVGAEGRLLYPRIGKERVGWADALAAVARGFADTIARHGPDAVAFYVSGQLLTEDYYVANKLMKGFIGSANIDTNSRLCMASSVAGHRRAFGADVVPGCYEDLELADLVVLVGSNLAWCHPVLFQRLLAARERRPATRIVVIDPRRSATAEFADLYLPIAPDGDVALFAGLLAHLDAAGAIDGDYVARHTSGLSDALAAAGKLDPDATAKRTGLSREALSRFYDWFAGTPRVLTIYSQGVNQSVGGTDKVNAIVNCHLATGRIGRPGMGPFSVTGQPNAMGGREVGGLANQLAAHLDIENAGHRELVRGFWRAPTIADRPGRKAVEMFEAVGEGRIKAIWIIATNPVDSLPEADTVRAALAGCPLVVVSDVVSANDTLPFAHISLPAAAWSEKDGTVTNSERRISRQRSFLAPPGEARPDWWMVCEVARRMGFGDAFAFDGPAAIFREHAALTALASGGTRPLDLAGIGDIGTAGYDAMAPEQWPVRRGTRRGTERLFADGVFATPDGRARFVATPPGPPCPPQGRFPLVLNTGRIRDHWHTMTRTGGSARLSAHIGEPFADIAPSDAEAAGIGPATLVRVTSFSGEALLRAHVTDAQRPGSIFVPMHWTDQFASRARVDALVAAAVDPVSGQPGLKQGRVAIAPARMAWYGFAVAIRQPALIGADYWALAKAARGVRIELAGLEPPADPTGFAERLLGGQDTGELVAFCDRPKGQHRFALFSPSGLAGALFVARQPVAASRSWLAGLLGDSTVTARQVLAGRPGPDQLEEGATVCSCHEVGAIRIAGAIAAGAATVEAIGAATRAGTNCGSCRSDLKRMLAAAPAAA